MSDKCIDISSQELCDIPKSVLDNKEAEILLLDFNSITTIPSFIYNEFVHLTCLSLNGDDLEALPENISKLSSLTELYLKENLLCKLPCSITKLKYLSKIHITGNQIKLLPDNFSLLQNLTEFVADENELEELPSDFGLLQNLSHLELSYNRIRQLPDNFGNLKSLKEFSIANNFVNSLPHSFQNLSCIEIMDITNNGLLNLPDNFASAEKVSKLFLSYNNITMLPEWFSRLIKVTEMDFHCNALQEDPFPNTFGDLLNNLEHLDMRGNCITSLPLSFGKLSSLKNVHLGSASEPERKRLFNSGNCISRLPDSFPQLFNLTALELDENNISELPADFGCLSNIVYLNLCHNNLKCLPDSFCDLYQLEICLLSINFLTNLPDRFGNLSSLVELNLDENLLIELPESFEKLRNLRSLDLYHNKLQKTPPCLKKLTSLKTLDLNENELDPNLNEVTEIYIRARYLVRDSKLKDNWRGREREGIFESLLVDNNDIEGRDNENDTLSYALKYSSSLWKRHGEIGLRKPKRAIKGNGSSASASRISDGENSSDSEWDYYQLNDKENILPSVPDVNVEDSSDSDWEKDFRENDKDGLLQTVITDSMAENFENLSDSDGEADNYESIQLSKKTYMHPVKTEFASKFVPSDIHALKIDRTEVWHFVEKGQFDDADL